MKIEHALALKALLSSSTTPELDTALLIESVSGRNASSLKYFGQDTLSPKETEAFLNRLIRRISGEPIAYIRGDQGFWSLDLKVRNSTLIPRPDTETLIETVLQDYPNQAEKLSCVDLGTGSGAIALAIASERPNWSVLGVDIIEDAVSLATENGLRLNLRNAKFIQGRWFEPLSGCFDLIVSNPPYIREDDQHLDQGDVRFEPKSALTSGMDGLDDIREIVSSATMHLNLGGRLYLEHGYDQGEAVRELLKQSKFTNIKTVRDLAQHERITVGQWKSE